MREKLVTVIIPCFNQVRYTKRCLDSVLRYTDHRCALVVIDNGSSDATRRFLLGLRRRPAANRHIERYLPIFNKTNIGVAAALNQGIAVSKGAYVCYLNNDTVVSDSWLGNLVRCAESDPRIGIVGCTTNAAEGGFPGEKSEDLKKIHRVASALSLRNSARCEDAVFVHGLCMLIKRKVIDRIGVFDERFYPCAAEDIDFSLRAKKAGFRLVNALDVFVYHYWSKATKSGRFSGRYADIRTIKDNSHGLFVEKWGEEGRRLLAAITASKERRSAGACRVPRSR
jgi:GT2 family glycosyltransferase